MLTYKFRIYPSNAQEKKINEHILIEKGLWNEMLAFVKKFYSDYGKFPTKKTLRSFCKKSGLYSQVGVALADRLNNSIWRMVKFRKQKKGSGFPRFKSIVQMKSLYYPQNGFFLKKKLKVTPFGEINIKKHRQINGKIKTLSLKREATGKWFASFFVEEPPNQPKINNGKQIGIDLGLINLATFSNGEKIKNPRHLQQYEERLAFFQKKLSKKKKGSQNRKKAKLKVAKLHEKISNIRKDFLHKTTTKLVNSYSLIALEKLATQEMAEQNFGKSINDAGWGMFTNMVRYKAESAGCKIIFVNPKNTTKECSGCHEMVKKDLTERTHNCPSCGLSIDRDVNAAKNILAKATVGITERNACGDETKVSSMKQEIITVDKMLR